MVDSARTAPFARAKGKLGFGCMRLPQNDDKTVRVDEFSQMVDRFLGAGLNYFDTAHLYLGGNSEPALRASLTSRHARDEYVLADKLSASTFERRDDIRPLVERQLAACGVDYFDLYLMHAQSSDNYDKYQRCHAYEEACRLREEGVVRSVGISFHDTAETLERILTEHPEVEFVQLQINYLDWESAVVQSRACHEVCLAHGKPVIVMEPVKGGTLAALPDDARAILAEAGTGSPASFALRFAASLPGVEMVLSGMGSMEMVEDNLSTFSPLAPLSEAELDAVRRVTRALLDRNAVGCTACRYCVDGCPASISIPDLLACLNARRCYGDTGAAFYYGSVHTAGDRGKASDCLGCGACEAVCPQHLPIRALLAETAREFEKEA